MLKTRVQKGICCPHCGKADKIQVLETRDISTGKRRRRICDSCGYKFSTYERIVPDEEKTEKLENLLDNAENLIYSALLDLKRKIKRENLMEE